MSGEMKYKKIFLSLAASLALLIVLFMSCGEYSSRKPELSSWKACVITDHKLVDDTLHRHDPVPGKKEIAQKGYSVLYVGTRWGRSLIIPEYSAAFLYLELPWPLKEKKIYEISKKTNSLYREGGQVLVWNSVTVTGKVEVKKINHDEIVLNLDLKPGENTMKNRSFKAKEIKGSVSARIFPSLKKCPD